MPELEPIETISNTVVWLCHSPDKKELTEGDQEMSLSLKRQLIKTTPIVIEHKKSKMVSKPQANPLCATGISSTFQF